MAPFSTFICITFHLALVLLISNQFSYACQLPNFPLDIFGSNKMCGTSSQLLSTRSVEDEFVGSGFHTDEVEGEDVAGLPISKYIHTLSTPDKGLAVFARTSIPAGTAIVIEAPLFTVSVPAMVPGKGFPISEMASSISTGFVALSPSGQEAFLGLHGYRYPSENPEISQGEEEKRREEFVSIFRTNAYNTGEGKVGVFPKIARINHACRPNAGNWWSSSLNQRVIYAFRDIPAGEEVTVSYIPLLKSRKERGKRLEQYGFKCSCDACAAVEEKGKESDKRRWRISERLEDLRRKSRDGRERKGEVWVKLLEKAEKALQMIREEEIWDYEGDAIGLARGFAEKAGRRAEEERWEAKWKEMRGWREGEKSL